MTYDEITKWLKQSMESNLIRRDDGVVEIDGYDMECLVANLANDLIVKCRNAYKMGAVVGILSKGETDPLIALAHAEHLVTQKQKQGKDEFFQESK